MRILQFMFRDRLGRLGILVCFAVSVAQAQSGIPIKTQSSADSKEIAEEAPGTAALLHLESDLRSELAAHPDSADTLYRLGLVLRQEGKPKESLESYTRAAQYRKPDADELRSVALDYVLLNDYTDAIHWLETAMSLEPGDADVIYSLGRCYYMEGRYHQAEELYLRVLQISPHHLKAEENLGLAYDAENQPAQAEAALRKAAEWAGSERSDPWPFLDLGAFLLDHDRAAESANFLQNATSIAPQCAPCHEKLGRALEKTGKAAEGARELEIAARLDPKNPAIHYELGRAYREAGDAEKARAEFEVSQELRREHDRE